MKYDVIHEVFGKEEGIVFSSDCFDTACEYAEARKAYSVANMFPPVDDFFIRFNLREQIIDYRTGE